MCRQRIQMLVRIATRGRSGLTKPTRLHKSDMLERSHRIPRQCTRKVRLVPGLIRTLIRYCRPVLGGRDGQTLICAAVFPVPTVVVRDVLKDTVGVPGAVGGGGLRGRSSAERRSRSRARGQGNHLHAEITSPSVSVSQSRSGRSPASVLRAPEVNGGSGFGFQTTPTRTHHDRGVAAVGEIEGRRLNLRRSPIGG